MIKITEFFLEESKVNKGCMNVIAVDENGQKWVVSGNMHSPTYSVKYEDAWDATTIEEKGSNYIES